MYGFTCDYASARCKESKHKLIINKEDNRFLIYCCVNP